MRQPVTAPTVAPAIAIAASLIWLGCTGCDADAQPGPTSTTSTGSGGASSSTSGTGAQGGQRCPVVTLPRGVPDGWVRLPGAPCECDVYMAPDAEHTKPVSWTSCGDGCQELVVDWSVDEAYRVLVQTGGAGGGERYLGFTRYLTDKGPYELQLLRLPDNVVLFDAIYQSKAGPWGIYARRASPFGILMELMGPGSPTSFEHHSVVYLVPTDGSALVPMVNGVVEWAAYETAVSSDLWAMSYQGAMAWGWHERAFDNEMNLGWSSPDGRTVFGIEAAGEHVFYSTWGGDRLSHVEVWTRGAGSAPLVSFASKADGGACCLLTDGSQMVWYQANGYLGDERYAEVWLMGSPFSTSAAGLEPTVVRATNKDSVIAGGGVIGGGLAVHFERPHGAPSEQDRLIVTRLADGYYWIIPPRAGFRWVQSLYVDAEELALIEGKIEGYHATNWTIVRLAIPSLGDPQPPGSGF